MKNLTTLFVAIFCMVVFMGAGEPGCEPMDRPIEVTDPDPDGDSDTDIPYPPDDTSQCDEMFEQCVDDGEEDCELIIESCFVDPPPDDCEVIYEQPPLPCGDMFERCVMSEPDPEVCDVILIYCEPDPIEPCDEMFEECFMLEESCIMLEESMHFCWESPEPLPECEHMMDEVNRCWDGVMVCFEEAEGCFDPEPAPCDDLLRECDMQAEECMMLEEELSFCWESPEPLPECEHLMDEINRCWDGVMMCQEQALEMCHDPDPCDDHFHDCDRRSEDCFMLESEIFEICFDGSEPSPDCEYLQLELEQCWMGIDECYLEAGERCFEPEPDPCEDLFVDCDIRAEGCMMFEEELSFCWESPEPLPECEHMMEELDQCWNDVMVCQDEAFTMCHDDPEPNPCDWVFEACDSGELSPDECDELLAECGVVPEP